MAREYESEFAEIRRRVREGDSTGAVELCTALAVRAKNPHTIVNALLLKAGQLFNLGRISECLPLLDRSSEILQESPDHALAADLYALVATATGEQSFERCVRHLAQGVREFDKITTHDERSVDAGHDLAVSLSYLGFHVQAMPLAERTYLQGQTLGRHPGDQALPEIAVRHAVRLDHRGDSVGCIRLLNDVVATWADRTDPINLWAAERWYYAYAMVRLAVLGERIDIDQRLFEAEAALWEVDDLQVLTSACMAMLDGQPQRTVDILNSRTLHSYTLGAAEGIRVRALAYAASGDYSAAMAADRHACRLASDPAEQLYDRLIESTKIQLDHETLRHTVERYTKEALTDPLTGLPNRRHFDRWLRQVRERCGSAAIGIIDLDNFKTVNTVHGHIGGDLVLQRIAAVLARTLRDSDFTARYGGDEFVIVLPRTTLEAAHEIGSRLQTVVSDEDWDALVAGTPVSITIGWASWTSSTNSIADVLDVADRRMLVQKDRMTRT